MKNKRNTSSYYIDGILEGDKFVLSKAITLVESSLKDDIQLSIRILRGVSSQAKSSKRIGITGVPGVGKSTFIESFGTYLIGQGKKIAVLAIDPSSNLSGGSILGDKTRMNSLSRNEQAFIRPSPTRNTLGGVTNHTRENILLCEAAGYDTIIVETVGVGQSETLVRGMVDFFLLLMLPGAGDDLQGIKKGIMEMADGILINKADGQNLQKAKQAMTDYKNALHLFSKASSGWSPQVKICSALENTGIEQAWGMIADHHQLMSENGSLDKLRKEQNLAWFKEQIAHTLIGHIFANDENLSTMNQLEQEVLSGKLSPKEAIVQLTEQLFGQDSFKSQK